MENVEIVSLRTVTRNNFLQREIKCQVPFQQSFFKSKTDWVSQNHYLI